MSSIKPDSYSVVAKVLSSELCISGQKVESVMRQCLNCVFDKKQMLRKRGRQELSMTDFSDMEIDPDALELMQVAATEFICFVTSDAIDCVT